MFSVLAVGLTMIVLLVVSVRLISLYLGRVVGSTVNRRHRDAESILDTERPPEAWTTHYRRTLENANDGARNSIENFAKRRTIRKLYRLMLYFEKSQAFADEESRRVVLDDIRRIGRRWEQASWKAINGTRR